MMDKGVVIVALGLLALANRSLALSCPPCDPATDCEPLSNCAYGVTKEACGCCDVCDQGPGEPCGGPWGTSGKCGDGLYCMNPCPTPGFLQGPPINQVGVCVGENNATYCNGMHEGLEYHYEYSSRLTAGLREVGRQEASSAFKADVRMQVQSQEVVIVQLSNIMVGDVNSEPLPCRESEDQDFQGIEYIPLVDNVDKLQIPFKLQIDKRKLINIIAPGDEPYWITNIRKSIAYLFSLPFLHSKQEPYFDEYGYSPFGECLTRYSLTPIMNELKLKENKKLSIEEDVQLGDSSPDALTKHKGVKGSSKTRKGSKGSKGAKGAKGSKGGTKGGPNSPTASDLVKVPRLADKMWRLTRSIDFEQCLDLVQVHSQGLKMVGTKDSPDDCGERHFSRSHDGTFILRGDLDGLRLEKAEVQGVYTVDALGTNEEHINSFAIQTINLVSVRLIEEEIIIENEGSLYAETQLRHDVTPYIDRGRSPDEFAEPKPTTVTEDIEDYKQRTVSKIREIVVSLSSGQSTHIVGDLDTMSQNIFVFSADDLQIIYDQLSDIEKKFFFKVLIVSGYETSYLFFFQKWSSRQVSDDVIFDFILNMANNIKSSKIVGVVQDMIINSIENQYLKGLALMNYAHLANRFCLNPCGYKNHRDHLCKQMDCTPFVTGTFIPWVTNMLNSEMFHSREIYMWERLIYLQTLANLHTVEVIPVVLPFVTDAPMGWANDEPIDIRLRIGAIYALRKENMPANAKKQICNILMALFVNHHEHYRVREYALLMLNHWNLPAAWWHRLAVISWQEPNQQVASLIYATITTMAKVDLGAKRVEALVKPASPNSLSNSRVIMYIKGNSEDMLRYWYDMVLSGNDEDLFPRMVKLYLRLGFLNQNFNGARLSGHFDGSNIWKYFSKMFDSFTPDQSQELVQEMFMELLEQLEMEPGNKTNNFEVHGFLNMFRSFEAMFSINQEEGTFMPFLETSLQMVLNRQYLVNTGRITTVITTEVGTQLHIDVTNPTFISTQSENFQMDFDQGTYKVDATIRLDSMKETHVKSMVPWTNQAMVAGIESRQEIKLPLAISGTLNIRKKQLSINFKPRDDKKDYILLVSNTPYTVRTPMQNTPRFSSLDDYKEVVSESLVKHTWPLIPVSGLAMTAVWESDMQPLVNAHINSFFSGFYSFSSLYNIMRPTARKYKFLWNVNLKEATTKSWTFTFNYMESKQMGCDEEDKGQQKGQQKGDSYDYEQYSQGSMDEYEDFGSFDMDAEMSKNFEQSSSKFGKITEQFSFSVAPVIYSIGIGLDFHGDDTRHFETVLTWANGFQGDKYGSKIQLTLFQGPYAMEMTHTTCLSAQFVMPYIHPLTTIDELREIDMGTSVKLEFHSDETCQGTPAVTGTGDFALSSEKKEMLIHGSSVECEVIGAEILDIPKILEIPTYDHISFTAQWDDSAASNNVKTIWNRFTDISHGSLFPFITSDRLNIFNNEKTFGFQAKKFETMWQVNVEKESENISIEQLYIPQWMEELVAPKRATDSIYESLITGEDGRPTCVISDQVSTFDGVRFENLLDNCWVVAAMDCQQGKFSVQVRNSGILEMRILWNERGFMIDVSKDIVMVNGEEVDSDAATCNYRLFKTEEFMLLQLTNLMAIKITESTFSISMAYSEKSSLCGICGNMDGERVADMTGPHGCVYSNTKDFMTSWTTSGEGCNAFSLRGRMKPVKAYRESCPKVQYHSAARIFKAYATGKSPYKYGYEEIEKDNYICTATQPTWSMMNYNYTLNPLEYPNNENMVYKCKVKRMRRGEEVWDNTNTPAGSKYPLPGRPIRGPLERCVYYTTWITKTAPYCNMSYFKKQCDYGNDWNISCGGSDCTCKNGQFICTEKFSATPIASGTPIAE